ncbi:MAG: YfiR family protein [Methylotenera sp.]|jgi:uncharacterized membrane protein
MNSKRIHHYLQTILFSILVVASTIAAAVTKEHAVKAGLIYNITKFVIWPNHAYQDEKFNFCIVGDDNLNGALEALYDKLTNGRPIVLRRAIKNNNFKECQILFIANEGVRNAKLILKELKKVPILTVSDRKDFINEGGMVGLIRDGNRVGFEVDIAVVKASGLHMSSQLLKLAKRVKGLK